MTDRTSFSGHDRRRLARALQRTDNVRLFRRVQAVLRVAEGVPINSTARTLRLSRRSLHRWVNVYLRRHQPEDLLDAPRTGRPRTADDWDEIRLTELLALRRDLARWPRRERGQEHLVHLASDLEQRGSSLPARRTGKPTQI